MIHRYEIRAFALGVLMIVALTALSAQPGPVRHALAALAGRYSQPVHVRSFDGEGPSRYAAENRLEILPTRGDRARISLDVAFDNGHACSVSGMARMEAAQLVYREQRRGSQRQSCVLRLWREGEWLSWSDGGNSCIRHCGMRGSLKGGHIPYASRTGIGRRGR